MEAVSTTHATLSRIEAVTYGARNIRGGNWVMFRKMSLAALSIDMRPP